MSSREQQSLIDATTDDRWVKAVESLTAREEWHQMWLLALRTPPIWSVRIIKFLNKRNWKPDFDAQPEFFDKLSALGSKCNEFDLPRPEQRQPKTTQLQEFGGRVLAARVTNDGEFLFVIDDKAASLIVYRLDDGSEVSRVRLDMFKGHLQIALGFDVSMSGDRAVVLMFDTVTRESVLQIHRFDEFKELSATRLVKCPLPGIGERVPAMALSADGKILFILTSSSIVSRWDLDRGTMTDHFDVDQNAGTLEPPKTFADACAAAIQSAAYGNVSPNTLAAWNSPRVPLISISTASGVGDWRRFGRVSLVESCFNRRIYFADSVIADACNSKESRRNPASGGTLATRIGDYFMVWHLPRGANGCKRIASTTGKFAISANEQTSATVDQSTLSAWSLGDHPGQKSARNKDLTGRTKVASGNQLMALSVEGLLSARRLGDQFMITPEGFPILDESGNPVTPATLAKHMRSDGTVLVDGSRAARNLGDQPVQESASDTDLTSHSNVADKNQLRALTVEDLLKTIPAGGQHLITPEGIPIVDERDKPMTVATLSRFVRKDGTVRVDVNGRLIAEEIVVSAANLVSVERDGRACIVTPDGIVLRDQNGTPLLPRSLGTHIRQDGTLVINSSGVVTSPNLRRATASQSDPISTADTVVDELLKVQIQDGEVPPHSSQTALAQDRSKKDYLEIADQLAQQQAPFCTKVELGDCSDPLARIALSNEGDLLAVAMPHYQNVRLFHLPDGRPLGTLTGLAREPLVELRVSMGGAIIAVTKSGIVQVFESDGNGNAWPWAPELVQITHQPVDESSLQILRQAETMKLRGWLSAQECNLLELAHELMQNRLNLDIEVDFQTQLPGDVFDIEIE